MTTGSALNVEVFKAWRRFEHPYFNTIELNPVIEYNFTNMGHANAGSRSRVAVNIGIDG